MKRRRIISWEEPHLEMNLWLGRVHLECGHTLVQVAVSCEAYHGSLHAWCSECDGKPVGSACLSRTHSTE